MTFRLPFKTIRAQLLVAFLVVAILPLAIFAVSIYRQRSQVLKEQALSKLAAIRDLKAQRIDSWMDDLESDARSVAGDVRDLLLPERRLPLRTDEATLRRLRDLLTNYVENHVAVTDVEVVDAATLRVVAAPSNLHVGQERSTSSSVAGALRERKLFLSGIHYSTVTNARRLTISVPLLLTDPAAPPAAVVVFDVHLDVLDKHLRERIGMGESGETLIVDRDVLALSELRWKADGALRVKLSGTPAILAAQGKTGVGEMTDYRGVTVLAAYTFLPRTGWGLVAKQDLAELHQAVTSLERDLLTLFPLCVFAVLLLGVAVARSFSRPLGEIQEAAEAIREGDFSARAEVDRKDEVGGLARAFNETADRVRSEIVVQNGSREIMDAMARPATLESFCVGLLPVILRATSSDFGAFFVLADDGRFVPRSSQGLSPGALAPFDAGIREGALGAALESREVSHLREIPPDTTFAFRTVAGTAVPREMLAIPVVVGDRVAAVIALASLRPFSSEALAVVGKSLPGFTIGFANLLSGEETRRLAEELSSTNAELEAQAIELKKQSDALRDQNVELEVQTARVAEANRLKSEFLSNMSHELRTPLNSVLALSRVLLIQAKDRLTAEEAGYLGIVERNGKHLLSLINDILDLARIESGRVELASGEVSLARTIQGVTEGLHPICREKGITLSVSVEEGIPVLVTDERRLRHVLQNLVGNAVKFTSEGGVSVAARRLRAEGGDVVDVVVADTGIGIPEKDLPHIFEEFRQVDGGTARSFEGTGLGLAIAARSARMLGGRISVASRVGAGSTFTLTLPLTGAALPVPPARPAGSSQAPAPSDLSTAGGGKLVLVVDDDPRDASLISAYLAREGYETVTALSGAEALRLAESRRPFAVTLDIVMPEMDGWEVLQALKRNPGTAPIPVIVVSMVEDRATGLALGAIGVVSKPVDPEALLAQVRRVAPSRSSLLVVDDEAADRRFLSQTLSGEGYEVREAKSGAECLELCAARVPDAITLDLMMPGMSGFDVLDSLRSDPATRGVPVLVVTARDLSSAERERLRGRVVSVLEKSLVSPVVLLSEIGQTLARLGRVPSLPPTPPGRKRRILVVEDSEAAIVQVRSVLEVAGYEVDVARGGEEAIERMAAHPPDGIVLDLMMPKVDGFAVLERMRGTPATLRTPVLILTAKDLTKEDLGRLSANHVRQYVQKGDIDRRELLRQVEMLFEPEAAPRTVPRPRSGERQRVRPPGSVGLPTILAIEDNRDNMTTLQAVLRGRCRLIAAYDGEEGLAAALGEKPDLVLLDVSLPKLDGFGVVARLRTEPATREVPVVALSAHAMKGDREKLLAAGCDDYVAKPVDVGLLLGAIERWLGPIPAREDAGDGKGTAP